MTATVRPHEENAESSPSDPAVTRRETSSRFRCVGYEGEPQELDDEAGEFEDEDGFECPCCRRR